MSNHKSLSFITFLAGFLWILAVTAQAVTTIPNPQVSSPYDFYVVSGTPAVGNNTVEVGFGCRIDLLYHFSGAIGRLAIRATAMSVGSLGARDVRGGGIGSYVDLKVCV